MRRPETLVDLDADGCRSSTSSFETPPNAATSTLRPRDDQAVGTKLARQHGQKNNMEILVTIHLEQCIKTLKKTTIFLFFKNKFTYDYKYTSD